MKIIRTLKYNFVFVIIIIFVHRNLSALNTSIHVTWVVELVKETNIQFDKFS